MEDLARKGRHKIHSLRFFCEGNQEMKQSREGENFYLKIF